MSSHESSLRVTLGPDETTILFNLADQFPGGLDLEDSAELTDPPSKRRASIALGNLVAIGAAERDVYGWRATGDGFGLINRALGDAEAE